MDELSEVGRSGPPQPLRDVSISIPIPLGVLNGGPLPQVTDTAPLGWQITGFRGRSGDELDRLGVIYTPAPASG